MDAILGSLQNPVILTVIQFSWGLVCKYVPKLKGIPNASIPWVNFVLALLATLAGPQPAAAAGFGGLLVGFFATVMQAGWSAIQTALIYEIFARVPLEKGIGLRKAS
jgi:hypothetical protein